MPTWPFYTVCLAIAVFLFLCGIEVLHPFGLQIFPLYASELSSNSPASGIISLIGGLVVVAIVVVSYIVDSKKKKSF